jgi:hypothetical protein
MSTSLYLDTARLGAMLPGAQRASLDFVRLAGEEGCSYHFDEFLRHGHGAWPAQLRRRYPGLSDWHGVAELKRSLRALAGAEAGAPVLLANRSAQLMKLAARLLFRHCRRVLVTDLEWPDYLAVLARAAGRRGRGLTRAHLRSAVLDDRCPAAEVVARVVARYRAQGCDGLFLTAVTHEGLRVPVAEILAALAVARQPPFVVVDGAQALGHAPSGPEIGRCDLYLAGCHKWLRAYHPMGFGFCGRRGSQGFVQAVCAEMADAGELDDPLLRFSTELERGPGDSFTETVALGCLFPCAAAVADGLSAGRSAGQRFADLVGAARQLEAVSAETAWTPLVPDPGLRSGILLLRNDTPAVRGATAGEIRRRFQERGVALTAYGNGTVRLSAPTSPWRPPDAGRLREALARCG